MDLGTTTMGSAPAREGSSAAAPEGRLDADAGPLPRVCVIGAGCCGLATIKALQDAQIPFDCFERGDRVGGNWVFRNANGLSSCYRSLHINTSRQRMQFACFPMPEDYPDYPGHALVARYFEDFASRFELHRRISFGVTVERVQPRPDGAYQVQLSDGRCLLYDFVVVANGHHWDPRMPEPAIPGRFEGPVFHSHDYLTPSEPHDLVGRRVLVVGMGNSAMDIASELGRAGNADRVLLSGRRGVWVLPKYLFGRPLDQGRGIPGFLPRALRQRIARAALRLAVGSMERFGLQQPDHLPGQAHPTISSEILERLGSGDVSPRRAVARFEGRRVCFEDGQVDEVDAVIFCTGYRVTFPFFDESFVSAPGNQLPLYLRMFRPGIAGLAFVGLCQPLGAVMPIAERQGRLLAGYLRGHYALPGIQDMQRAVARDETAQSRRYVHSPRHTMQVDFDDFMGTLARELKEGAARARRNGQRLPVQARARFG